MIQEIENAAKELLNELDVEILSNRIVQFVGDFIAVDKVILYQKTPKGWEELAEKQAPIEALEKGIFEEYPTPNSILNTVIKNEEPLLYNAFANVRFFAEDEYIISQKPSFVYCVNLFPQQNILLYLENNEGNSKIPQEISKTLQPLIENGSTAFQNIFKQSTPEIQSTKKDASNIDSATAYEDFKLLGQIGQDINANLSVEKIIEAVYENINTLMDASVFDIGIYNKEKRQIEFPGSIEKGEKLEFNVCKLSDTQRLAVICFREKKEIVIGNFQKEYGKYVNIETVPTAVAGEDPESLIYLPITNKGETIGVITVQSFQQNSYTEYHLNILRNLAIYVAIALENAFLYEDLETKREQQENSKKQHEQEMQQAYANVKLLGEIGQDVTANLSIAKIVETVHSNVNSLMAAPLLSIGVYNSKKSTLDVQANIDDEFETTPFTSYGLDEEEHLAVFCFKNMREIFINDYDKDYKKYLLDLDKPPIPKDGKLSQSIIYLPLIGKNDTVGTISVQSFEKNAYTAYHLNMLRNIAVYASIAIDNALLYQTLEDRVEDRTREVVFQKDEVEKQHQKLEKAFDDIELLSDIGQKLTSFLSVPKIVASVYESVNSLMDAAAFGIGIFREAQNDIEFQGAIENGEPLPTFYHNMEEDTRFSVWCIKHNREALINDYANEYQQYIPEMKSPEEGEDPESLIYMPLISKEKVMGVITVQSFKKQAYSEYQLNMLKNLAIYAAIALENAQSYTQIEAQHEQIQKSSRKLTASINYAQRIQEALLPHRAEITKSLPDFFVFFKPKDIVSGDFFWFAEKNNKIFLAAVDCTGHGVPGALMSMIGNEYLNEIVNYTGLEDPGEILSLLHKEVRKALKQEQTSNRDGMDIALCVIDKESCELKFSGAERPIIHINNGELEIIKGDRRAIGGQQKEEERIFTSHTIPINAQSVFYIFSDGYQDQFGVSNRKKFMLRNMKELFLNNYKKPFEEQREILKQTFNDWKGDTVQIDDVLVIGFKPL